MLSKKRFLTILEAHIVEKNNKKKDSGKKEKEKENFFL
jgi:hypothetical protein